VFLNSALVGSEESVSRLGRFTPVKESLVPSGKEVGLAPEPVWTRWRRENSLTVPGIEPMSSIP